MRECLHIDPHPVGPDDTFTVRRRWTCRGWVVRIWSDRTGALLYRARIPLPPDVDRMPSGLRLRLARVGRRSSDAPVSRAPID